MVPRERLAPVGDAVDEVGDDLVVVGLEARDDLEDQHDVAGGRRVEHLEQAAGVDAAAGIVLDGERPMVVGIRVGLLQVDDGSAAAETPQPSALICESTSSRPPPPATLSSSTGEPAASSSPRAPATLKARPSSTA